MSFPQRKKRSPMGLRESSVVRCQGHLKYVRGFECCVAGKDAAMRAPNFGGKPPHVCEGKMEAHHLQSYRAIEGGMGMKVGDDKCVPLCGHAHQLIHTIGQSAFSKRYDVNLEHVAADLWRRSPHRIKYEQQKEAP